MKRLLAALAACASVLAFAPGAARAQPALSIKPLAEKKVAALPSGALFWRIENFASIADARSAAGPHGLAVESRGKAWLFTLGAPGGATAGGAKVAELGPIPRVDASQYLLRINEATGAPGSVTKVHSHPGSEAFYVVAGEQSIRSPAGVMRVTEGKYETGQGADVAMQVSSTGTVDLHALVMFVVDASRPFSSPAKLAGQGH